MGVSDGNQLKKINKYANVGAFKLYLKTFFKLEHIKRPKLGTIFRNTAITKQKDIGQKERRQLNNADWQ